VNVESACCIAHQDGAGDHLDFVEIERERGRDSFPGIAQPGGPEGWGPG